MITVPPRVAAHVLYHFGYAEGMQPGRFIATLIELLVLADSQNFARLTTAFPEYAHAVALAKNNPHGIVMLVERVRSSQ